MPFKRRSKTSIAIKICGITKSDQAESISHLGVDAIGVIGVASSPRFVEEDQRRNIFALLEKLSPSIKRVWVVADIHDYEVASALTGKGVPSVIQLHGNESKERCEALRNRYPKIEWWKALRVNKAEDLVLANNFKDKVDCLLLDAWAPNQLGGTGKRIPLNLIKGAHLHTPWWLAGGISEEWVPEILSKINPYGLDISSKVESSPGIKDINLVKNLIRTIRDQKS